MLGSKRDHPYATFGSGLLAVIAMALLWALAAPADSHGADTGNRVGKAGKYEYVRKAFRNVSSNTAGYQPNIGCSKGYQVAAGGADLKGGDAELSWRELARPGDSRSDKNSTPDNHWKGSLFWEPKVPQPKPAFWAICKKASKKKKSRLDYRSSTSGVIAEDEWASHSVSCKSEKWHAVGGGWRWNTVILGPGHTDAAMTLDAPWDGPDPRTDPDDGWEVGGAFGLRSAGNAAAATLTAWVVCMREKTPAYKRRTYIADGQLIRDLKGCKGRPTIGGGAAFAEPDITDLSHVAWSAPFDSDDKGKVPEDGWRIAAHSEGVEPVQAWAICG